MDVGRKVMSVAGLSILPAFFKKKFSTEKRVENLIEKGHGQAAKWWNLITDSLTVTRNGGPLDRGKTF